jgi:Tfp pilus assembly protein PilF
MAQEKLEERMRKLEERMRTKINQALELPQITEESKQALREILCKGTITVKDFDKAKEILKREVRLTKKELKKLKIEEIREKVKRFFWWTRR